MWGHCLGETSSKISDCENNHTEGRVPQPNMAFCLTFKISSICSFSDWSKSKCISVSRWSRFSLFFCETFRCSCRPHHFKAMTSHFGSIPIMSNLFVLYDSRKSLFINRINRSTKVITRSCKNATYLLAVDLF